LQAYRANPDEYLAEDNEEEAPPTPVPEAMPAEPVMPVLKKEKAAKPAKDQVRLPSLSNSKRASLCMIQ